MLVVPYMFINGYDNMTSSKISITSLWFFFVLVNAYYGGALTMFFVSEITLPFKTIRDVLQVFPSWNLVYLDGNDNYFKLPASQVFRFSTKWLGPLDIHYSKNIFCIHLTFREIQILANIGMKLKQTKKSMLPLVFGKVLKNWKKAKQFYMLCLPFWEEPTKLIPHLFHQSKLLVLKNPPISPCYLQKIHHWYHYLPKLLPKHLRLVNMIALL